MILDRPALDADAFEAATGWKIEPRGACKGDVCVPLGGDFELADAASRLGMALIDDAQHGLWALGPETLGGRALASAEVPDLVFDTLDGGTFHLSSLRGQKVLLVAWAPY